MALHEDLVIPAGKSWVSPTWALLLDGEPVTLTGRTVKAQVRESARDSQVLHEWSTTAGNVRVVTVTVVVENADGSTSEVETAAVALTVKPSESAAWAWRVGVYDVESTSTTDADDVWPIIEESTVRVASEVTR